MILVTGATGHVGGELVKQLTAANYEVRALARNPNGLDTLPDAAHKVSGDLNQPDSLHNVLKDVQKIFLLGGFREMPALLAEIRRAGIGHVVLLTSRSVIGGALSNAIVDMWLTSENAVRSSGVPWTILRPSGFMSNSLEWATQIRNGDLIRAPFPSVSVAAIDPYDIAAVAAVTLTSPATNPRLTRFRDPNRFYRPNALRYWGKALGRELRFEGLSDIEAEEELRKSFPRDFVEAFLRFFSKGEFDDSPVIPTVSEILGRQPHTFVDWVRSHIDEFR